MREVKLNCCNSLVYPPQGERHLALCGLWLNDDGEPCLDLLYECDVNHIRFEDLDVYVTIPEYLADQLPSSHLTAWCYDPMKFTASSVRDMIEEKLCALPPLTGEDWFAPLVTLGKDK